MKLRKIRQNKWDKKYCGECRISYLYRMTREGLFDKVTFERGSERSEGQFGDIKAKSVPYRKRVDWKGLSKEGKQLFKEYQEYRSNWNRNESIKYEIR